jgi:FixJ family two-component response regulator
VTPPPLVSVVDDDESVRESLPDLLRELGFRAQGFASADELLRSKFLVETDCLILDVAMPGMDGLALQQELLRRRHTIPIVFVTAHVDEGYRPRAFAAGAVDYLTKPFTDAALLAALNAALRAG